MNAQIIQELHAQRRSLESDLQMKRASLAQTQTDLDRITTAIAALEGKALPVAAIGKEPEGPPVTEILLDCAKGCGAIFDQKTIAKVASEKFPAKADLIRRGVYNACATLLKKEKIFRAPGGFTLTKPPQIAKAA